MLCILLSIHKIKYITVIQYQTSNLSLYFQYFNLDLAHWWIIVAAREGGK